MRLITEMVGQLDLHRPLHQPLGQIGEQPAGPGDLLLRARAGEQLIDHLIADPLRGHPESLPQTTAATGTIDGLIDKLRRKRPPGRPAVGAPAAGAPPPVLSGRPPGSLRSPAAGNTSS